jgi:hypothetical protein
VALHTAALNEETNADGGCGARCGCSFGCTVSGCGWTSERWQPGNGSVMAARRAGELGRHSGEKREWHRGSHGGGSGAASTGERSAEEKNKKGEAARRVRLPRLEVARRA